MLVFVVFGLYYLIYSIVVNLGAGLQLPTAHANPCCYVWLYYNWFFVFNCICAVLRGSLLI